MGMLHVAHTHVNVVEALMLSAYLFNSVLENKHRYNLCVSNSVLGLF